MEDEESSRFRDLGLAEWPFRLVPLAGPTQTWYDRAGLKGDLERLMWRLGRHDDSTLQLLWADVGSGKTHTLRFLEYRAAAQRDILPAYAVMPKVSRSFVDLYGAIARSLDLAIAAATLQTVRTTLGEDAAADVIGGWPDLLPALTLYRNGLQTDRDLVRRWLTGSRDLTKSDLRRVGIAQAIRTSDHAVAALTAMSRLYLTSRRRLLVLIDELQRIGTVRSTVANEISAGLHTWFNDVPQGLALVLTFAFGDKSHVDALLTRELLSRADHQRLEMGSLTSDEALTFVRDAVAACRLSEAIPTALNDEMITAGVNALGRGTLTPRNVMKGFNALLTEVDYRQQLGRPVLKTQEIPALLHDIRFDADDDE